MKKSIIILIATLLWGCSINKHFIGKYASHDNPNNFQFKSDSTFLNEYTVGHAIKYSNGTWEKGTGHTIILNSQIKNIDIPLKLTQLDFSGTDTINLAIDLKINDGLELSNYHCYIYLNNKVFKIKRCDSISSIKLKSPVESLYFVFTKDPFSYIQYTFPVITEKLKFNEPISHNIRIQVSLKDLFFTYHLFNNEVIKVKRNRMQLFNSYLNKWQNIPKVSDKSNIFIHFNN